MLKNIKKYSVVALATLVILGCGGSGDTKITKDLSTYSDAEKLAYHLANKDKTTKAGQSDKEKRSRYSQQCAKSGSIDFGDFDPTNYIDNLIPTSMTFKNCDDGEEIINGTMKMDLDDNAEGTVTYLSDFTAIGGDDEVFIKKGGTITMYMVDGWEELTINLTSIFNGITHAGENLVYRGKELSNGGDISFPVSGKEKIGDSAWFDVDESYDASATPFTTNSDGELTSGLFKYTDANNHAVEIEVISKDIIAVRVNENGDGAFTNDEKSIINLAQ